MIEQLKIIHDAGYVHNHIKPGHIIVENLNLSTIGKCVRLIDFSDSQRYNEISDNNRKRS